MRLLKIIAMLVSVALMASVTTSQTLGSKRSNKPRPISVASEPAVTKAEVSRTLAKVRKAIYQVVLKRRPASSAEVKATSPATRTEIVKQLHDIFVLAQPEFKYTPNKVVFDPKLLTVPTASPVRGPLEKLIAWGAIGRVDPVATASTNTLTLEEFGDAVGLFLLRICELTHTPSTKFSPALISPDDF